MLQLSQYTTKSINSRTSYPSISSSHTEVSTSPSRAAAFLSHQFNTCVRLHFTTTLILAALTAPAPCANKYKIEVRSSEKLVDVGNIDLFAQTWKAIYAAEGNQQAVTIDHTANGQLARCHADFPTEVFVHTYVDGAWADVGGIHHEARDAMVEGMWAALQDISAQHQRDIFTGCCFTDDIGASCVPLKSRACTISICGCQHGQHAQCSTKTTGHLVPSHINAWVYFNGVQRDYIKISFTTTHPEVDGGCGNAGKIASGLASFIFPGPLGAIFEKGIAFSCEL